MPPSLVIENIEELRHRNGIDDPDLGRAIGALLSGDHVKLTLLTGATPAATETLVVRITSIVGRAFRGKLVAKPALAGLAHLGAGSVVNFDRAHIHSLVKRRAAVPAGSAPHAAAKTPKRHSAS